MERYIIAGHTIQITGKELTLLPGFDSFVSGKAKEKPLLAIYQEEEMVEPNTHPAFSSALEGKTYDFFSEKDRYLFRIQPSEGASMSMEIRKEKNNFQAKINGNDKTNKDSLRFILWQTFCLAALHHKTVSIHASTVMHRGKSILFLGESGTGKSTHTRLWLNHIPGSELLNDDSPFIRVDEEGNISVYGSPWSGKTSCYKNLQTPVAAFVRLSQAPYNRIRPLKGIEAIGALLPSCPYMFAYDKQLQESIYEIISLAIQQIPVYHLECLPDAEAARLVLSTLQEKAYI